MLGSFVVEEEKEEKDLYKPGTFKEQFFEIFGRDGRLLGFLFKPGAKDPILERRDFELNKYKSKRSFFRRLKAPLTILGICIVFVVTSWAVFCPWLSHYTYDELTAVLPNAYAPPSPAHPLGTTEFGRDVLGRLIWGARASLTLGLLSILVSVVGGIFFGMLAAYFRGWVDNVIMRTADVIMAFPSLILTIIIVSILGQKIEIILMIWGFMGIPGYARLMRGAALQEMGKTYVTAAKVSGASHFRTMFRHVLPNAISPIVIAVTFDIGGIILGLAGLSFLGFGAEGYIEWGNDIFRNKSKLTNAPWAALWPGFGIVITVLGFMLLGDGLRDALDPRTRV